ncbi:MAG: hypothetical protein KAI41_06440, partial [Hyphomicrobiaceae bacterium]|nr:hypothetical protein [Hyphomicrobiaceae bacterium]
AFATGATAAGNVNRVFILPSTWEQLQDLGGVETGLLSIGGFDDGVDTSRTQQIPDFYDDILNQEAFGLAETVEGPLAFRGGLDFPMQRSGIVIELKDNYSIREQTVASAVDGHGPAFSAGGFKFIPKVGRRGKAGLTSGLLHVVNAGMDNTLDGGIGVILSYTLDGTIFSETLVAGPPSGTNIRIAFIDLMDAIDADPRFNVVNRFEDTSRTQVVAQIVRSSPNIQFEAHSDVGVGLRVEFHDISP